MAASRCPVRPRLLRQAKATPLDPAVPCSRDLSVLDLSALAPREREKQRRPRCKLPIPTWLSWEFMALSRCMNAIQRPSRPNKPSNGRNRSTVDFQGDWADKKRTKGEDPFGG